MPDLDELDPGLRAIAEHGARAARGLPTTEIRRRGSRRRIARLVTSAAAVVALTAGATAVFAGSGDVRTAPPAGRGLSTVELPDELTYRDGARDLRWVVATTSSGEDGSEPVSVCQQGTLASLGATDVRTRAYTWVIDLQPGEVDGGAYPDPEMGVVVGQFADADAGRAAYRAVGDWIVGCEANSRGGPEGPTAAPVRRFSTVDGPAGQGWTALVLYEEDPPVDPDAVVFDAHAVGLSADGTRVVLVSERHVGQDYNAPPDEAPITVRLGQLLRAVS